MKRLGICALGFCVAFVTQVAYGDYLISFIEIADTSTSVPGTGGIFTSFQAPVADRENGTETAQEFFFIAQSSNGNSGVYEYIREYVSPQGFLSSMDAIADTRMSAPTGGSYSNFFGLTGGRGEIGFVANTTTGTQDVMEGDPYTFLTFLTATGASPATGQTFSNFQSLSFMGSGLFGSGYLPSGEISSNLGIYDFNYPYPTPANPNPVVNFSLIANTSTIPPGASSPFTSFGPVSYKAFQGLDTEPGIPATIRAVRATAGGIDGIYYGGVPGAPRTSALLVKLVDTTSGVPDSNGNPLSGGATFTSFGDPSVSTNEIAFSAHYGVGGQDQQGLFAYGPYLQESPQPPVLHELVATGQPAPDGNGATFTSFSSVNAVAFEEDFLATLSNGVMGIYGFQDDFPVPPNSPISSIAFRILDTTETLNGKAIANIQMSSEASAGVGTAFEVDFTDGSEGIYFFNVSAPEPASLTLLAFPLLLVRRRNA